MDRGVRLLGEGEGSCLRPAIFALLLTLALGRIVGVDAVEFGAVLTGEDGRLQSYSTLEVTYTTPEKELKECMGATDLGFDLSRHDTSYSSSVRGKRETQ